jgi:hypothetical protein
MRYLAAPAVVIGPCRGLSDREHQFIHDGDSHVHATSSTEVR